MQNSENLPKQVQTMITSLEIDISLHSKLKVYAAKNRMKIKDVVSEALIEYFKKRGEL